MPSSSALAVDASRSSASTIAAETETGSHQLTISGYSGTKVLGVGKFIRSSVFSVGGYNWCIRYYPYGPDKERANWISVYLNREDGASDANVKARFRFSLLDHVGEAVPLYSFTSKIRTFTSKDLWGYPHFIKREDLESSPHLRDDSFRISCHVTVVNFNVVEKNTLLFHVSQSMDLCRDLGGLLTSKIGADVEFMVGREMFKAHKAVLASRSSVLKKELFGFMKDMKKETQIVIEGMEASVFGVMLHFIYTDTLPEIDECDRGVMAKQLLAAADRYKLRRLKLISDDVLCKFIDTNTAATTLALAEQHRCPRLKEGCFNFLKYPGNMKAVMVTDCFGHLTSSCPSLLKELLAKLSP
ncbi:unnamed protein product [Urochloa humidicola]